MFRNLYNMIADKYGWSKSYKTFSIDEYYGMTRDKTQLHTVNN